MPAIIAMLLQNGLGLLAGVVQKKGKDWLEKKTGVKLPEGDKPELPPEQLLQLKEAELTHEEEFQRIMLEDKKADLADTADARDREVKVATSKDAPELNKVITPILAILIVVGGGILLHFGVETERTVAQSLMTLVLGYYFGSSNASHKKDETIAQLSKE